MMGSPLVFALHLACNDDGATPQTAGHLTFCRLYSCVPLSSSLLAPQQLVILLLLLVCARVSAFGSDTHGLGDDEMIELLGLGLI
jgi:hypothetical protein